MNKICTRCGQQKPVTEFHWASIFKSVRQSKCKQCVLVYAKQYAAQNPEKIKIRNAEQSRKKSEERLNTKNPFVSLYKECPDCKQTMYYNKFGLRFCHSGNKVLRTRCTKCEYERLKNKDPDYLNKALSRTKKNATNNPDKYRESVKAWKAANPEKVAKHKDSYKQTRMKRVIEQSDGTMTHEAVKRLFAVATNCFYCNKPFGSAVEKSLDHKMPVSKGGAHSIYNVVISCLPCNIDKSTMTAEEYAGKQKATC
jgi:hypothetical protein